MNELKFSVEEKVLKNIDDLLVNIVSPKIEYHKDKELMMQQVIDICKENAINIRWILNDYIHNIQ